jgi:RNA polymerase sigma factor (sigma-70 family)
MSVARAFTNGNKEAAEDLVQDTIYRILKYSPDPAKIENPDWYLARSLKNIWIDQWKKIGRFKMQSLSDEANKGLLDEMPITEPAVTRTLENQDLRKALRIVSGNLKPDKKEVFKLFLKGYDCDEIAVMLNKDPLRVRAELNGVRANIRYWVRKLKNH